MIIVMRINVLESIQFPAYDYEQYRNAVMNFVKM
jgi:hypothetical protein